MEGTAPTKLVTTSTGLVMDNAVNSDEDSVRPRDQQSNEDTDSAELPTQEWTDEGNTKTLFTGVFTAVATTFCLEAHKSFRNYSMDEMAPDARLAVASAWRARAFLFISLALSLASTLASLLSRPRAQRYLRVPRSGSASSAPKTPRALRSRNLSDASTLLITISLVFFFGGMFEFYSPLSPVLAYLSLAMAIVVACTGVFLVLFIPMF